MTTGETAETTVSWQGLPAGQTYLAVVDQGDGTGTVHTTFLTVSS